MAASPPPPPAPLPPPPPPPSLTPAVKKSAPKSDDGGGSFAAMLAKKAKVSMSETVSEEMDVSLYAKSAFFQDKSKTGFVGLSNQGATCYLNSLMQTLFMTPEFKDALYNWNYSIEIDGPESSCIPLQLQRLFARLQLGDAAIVETKELTSSFGWTASDAFRQHDVQELLRKLFEAMEITFKRGNLQDTSVTPVNFLYEGMLKDYIQCQTNTSHERVRYDPFMDLLLSIGSIASRGPVGSLEESLDRYVEEESLDGDNKWKCDACSDLVGAKKGLRIKTAPTFLTLQLKRFDYDYSTWQRIKLNNRVTFPTTLDINRWIVDPPNTPTEFELFSVLIHSGGAMGGHYYAIIKNMENGKWIKFNDSSVSDIDEKEIEQMYGGADPKNLPVTSTEKTSENKSVDETEIKKQQQQQRQQQIFSTNAYLLFYRKKSETVPKSRDIPAYLKEFIKNENIKFQKEKEEWIKVRDNLPLEIYFSDKVIKHHIDKNKTLSQLTEEIFPLTKLSESEIKYTIDCIRIRKFNPKTSTMGKVWSEEHYGKTLDSLGVVKGSILKVETRLPTETFPKDLGEYKLQIVKVNEAEKKFDDPSTITVPFAEATLLDVKRDVLVPLLGWTVEEQLVAKVSPDASVKIFKADDLNKQLLADLGFVDGNVLHVEKIAPNTEISEENCTIVQIFEEAKNLIHLFYNKLGESELDQEVAIDKRKTIGELRILISRQIGIPTSDFKLCKSKLGNEFKDDAKLLTQVSISDGDSIFLQKGKPAHLNQLKLIFTLYDPKADLQQESQPQQSSLPSVSPSVLSQSPSVSSQSPSSPLPPPPPPLFPASPPPLPPSLSPPPANATISNTTILFEEEVPTNSIEISRIREIVAKHNNVVQLVSKKAKSDVQTENVSSYLRLRLKSGTKLSPIMFDYITNNNSTDNNNDSNNNDNNSNDKNNTVEVATLKSYIQNMSIQSQIDRVFIAVEILDSPEFVKPGELLVFIQRWYPSKQDLAPEPTQLVVPVNSNYVVLKNHVATSTEIPYESILFAKPRLYQLKNKNTLGTLVNWNINLQETKIEDGDFILFKDGKDAEVELTNAPSNSGNSLSTQPKEVGIKIYTMYDKEGREKFKELQKEKELENKISQQVQQPAQQEISQEKQPTPTQQQSQ